MIPQNTRLPERPSEVPAWETLREKQCDELDLRMATYAAQVELLDRGVGRIVKALRDTGRLNNAPVISLSDNGAASAGGALGAGPADLVGKPETPVRTTYGMGWAALSNTPYRMFKANTHEGGIMSPLIMHWPSRVDATTRPGTDISHIVDIAPTCLAAAVGKAKNFPHFEGVNLLGESKSDSPRVVYYEHEGSRAVRQGQWKLVNRGKSWQWELYDLQNDRTEAHNRAGGSPERAQQLSRLWQQWAERCNVRPE